MIRRKKKSKTVKIKTLKHLLDLAFAAMIRSRDFELGCISCVKGGVEQAGHLVQRGKLPTRWHPQNVNGQCIRCNHFISGNLLPYAINIEKKYGLGTAEKLTQLSRISWKPDREALENLLAAAKIGHEQYEETWSFYGAKLI